MKHKGNSINLYTEVKLDILNEIILCTGVNLLKKKSRLSVYNKK